MLYDPRTGKEFILAAGQKVPPHILEKLEPDYRFNNGGFFAIGQRARFITFTQKASGFKNKS